MIREEHGPAKIVVTTNTFHHIGDLDPFTLGVTLLLADDGVFVVEVPHAGDLVEQNEFDGVYHEHVSQHTVKSFVDHFRLFGLEVFDVERLEIHGGSIRVFARRATNGRYQHPSSASGSTRRNGAACSPHRHTTRSARGSSGTGASC